MDLMLKTYEHAKDFAVFWKIFCDFWMEVNQVNLEKLKTVSFDGKLFVSSDAEEKILSVLRDAKVIKMVLNEGIVIAFMQYHLVEKEALFVDSLYIEPKSRYAGVARFLINSFPRVKKVIFQCHAKNPPDIFLKGFLSCKKIGKSDAKDLEWWEGEYLPESQGVNENVIKMKEELRG